MKTVEIQDLKSELSDINAKLNKIHSAEANSYTAQVSKAFPLGMVGGSGRNNGKLNKRRGQELERTIAQAHINTELYKRQSELEKQIEYIESGQRERDIVKKQTRAEKLAQWFKGLNAGDTFTLFTGNEVTIAKVNAKSVVSVGGVKWSASEVIGLEASKLL